METSELKLTFRLNKKIKKVDVGHERQLKWVYPHYVHSFKFALTQWLTHLYMRQ